MQKSNLNILSTRPLAAHLIDEAAKKGVTIDCISFIETQPVISEDIQVLLASLARQPLTAVFTSMNAVDAVKEFTGEEVKWKIYCISSATSNLISKIWGADKIAGTSEYGETLADIIISNGETEVVFFCGDHRRDVLPQKLKAQGIKVKELIVYHTLTCPHSIKKHYDGILFFSPSAVNSYFLSNQPGPGTVIFAIGNTTASALQQKGWGNILTADRPDKEELVKKMLAYFQINKRI